LFLEFHNFSLTYDQITGAIRGRVQPL